MNYKQKLKPGDVLKYTINLEFHNTQTKEIIIDIKYLEKKFYETAQEIKNELTNKET